MTAGGETSTPDRATKRRNPRRSGGKARLQPLVGGKRQRLEDVNVLLDVAQRISGTETLDEILEELVEMTSTALGCDRSSFFLYDAGTGELYSRVAQGIRRREIRLLSNDGIIRAGFQSGDSLHV